MRGFITHVGPVGVIISETGTKLKFSMIDFPNGRWGDEVSFNYDETCDGWAKNIKLLEEVRDYSTDTSDNTTHDDNQFSKFTKKFNVIFDRLKSLF